ncbi:unnamed protein product [Arctia plantaginis]|uniref:Hyaluronidase n=1 Tax=Arctia plantaginis TaxID=874455 RepID=A0A8S0ZZ34_ARCPL|nr:unnamed protein product [Arctia plantaginis]
MRVSYYVVRMPEPLASPEFKVYWNVPTMQCKSKNIIFDNLFEKYGIIHNTDDIYRGNEIAILYDPGNFPALIKNSSTGEIKYRNGGVPQEGDLMDHLQNFKKEMDKSIPNEDFSGVGIIDFESWRPILRQNFGSLTPYKDVSYDIEKKRHWWWNKQRIENEAKRRFNAAGRDFMHTTISLAKKMRPKARWGYYGYPQCFNRPYNSHPEECAEDIPGENNRIPWLWEDSTALFPSVYCADDVTGNRLAAFIKGRIKESERVRVKPSTPILPYWWFRYRDGGYFKEQDLETTFSTFHNSKASGFIIWGSSKDVNTKIKCTELKKYLTDILGPAVAKYTKVTRRINDEPADGAQVIFITEAVTEFDSDYHWEPPVNYTSNIEHIVEEELKTKKEDEPTADGNVLIDIILNRIANFCLTNCDSENEVKLDSTTVLTTKDPFAATTPKITTTVRPVEAMTTEYSNTGTTVNHETVLYDYLDTSSLPSTTTVGAESNEFTTIGIYVEDDDTSEFNASLNNIEINTEDFREIERTQQSTETISRLEDNNAINFINNTSSFNETRDKNKNSTINAKEIDLTVTKYNFNTTTTIIPKLYKINNNNLVNFSTTVTNAPNFSSNDTSVEYFSPESRTNLSDTRPSNLHITTTPASRPDPINWRKFYVDLLNLPNLVKKEFGTTDENEVETTAAPELVEQVVVSVV